MPVTNMQRAAELAVLYAGGCTLEEIGQAVGLTRERVRQLIRASGYTVKQNNAGVMPLCDKVKTVGFRAASGMAREELAAKRANRRAATKDRLIKALTVVWERTQPRVPGYDEVMAEAGYRKNSNPSGHFQTLCRLIYHGTTPREASQLLYAEIGLELPKIGARWMVDGYNKGAPRKTQCKRGHDLTLPDSCYTYTRFQRGRSYEMRLCRACKRLTANQWYAAKKAKVGS